jgi:hypothetical protein
LFCPISVDLNSVATRGHVLKQIGECHSIANAGIERRKSFREGQPTLQTFGFKYWKREKA